MGSRDVVGSGDARTKDTGPCFRKGPVLPPLGEVVARLEESARPKGHGAALGDDDVIEDADTYELADLNEPLRDCEVLLAGLRIPTRMIVNEHD